MSIINIVHKQKKYKLVNVGKVIFTCCKCKSSIGYIPTFIFNKLNFSNSNLAEDKKVLLFKEKCEQILESINKKDLKFFSDDERKHFFQSLSCSCLKKEFGIKEVKSYGSGYSGAWLKNYDLSNMLSYERKEFCGIGTNKVKRRLNKLSIDNINALLYRKALEIEDVSIQAKRSFGKYRDKKYEDKNELMQELVDICSGNGIVCGYQNSDNYSCKYIIFFELPNCEQISWHSNSHFCLSYYNSKWDKKVNSTLDKLEIAIEKLLGENKLLGK